MRKDETDRHPGSYEDKKDENAQEEQNAMGLKMFPHEPPIIAERITRTSWSGSLQSRSLWTNLLCGGGGILLGTIRGGGGGGCARRSTLGFFGGIHHLGTHFRTKDEMCMFLVQSVAFSD